MKINHVCAMVSLASVSLVICYSTAFAQPAVPSGKAEDPSRLAVRPPIRQGSAEPPQNIVPPPIPIRGIEVYPGKLPKNSHAILPAYDGDGLFVILSPSSLSGIPDSDDVFNGTIKLILAAVGIREETDSVMNFYQPEQKAILRQPMKLDELFKLRCKRGSLGYQDALLTQFCGGQDQSGQSNHNETRDVLTKMWTGIDFSKNRKALERVEYEFFYPQVHRLSSADKGGLDGLPDRVALEHTGLLVTGWERESPSSVNGHVFVEYSVGNHVAFLQNDVIRLVQAAMIRNDLACCENPTKEPLAALVLLPYGEANGKAEMRFAYRVPVMVNVFSDGHNQSKLFFVWLDAGDKDGRILKLIALTKAAVVNGDMYVRDLGSGQVENVEFEIDDAAGLPGQETFKLQWEGRFSRLDRDAPPSSSADPEVEAPANAMGTPPNFSSWLTSHVRVGAKNHPDQQCVYDQTDDYPGIYAEQIDLMATLSRRYQEVVNIGGLLDPFPARDPTGSVVPIQVKFNISNSSCRLSNLSDFSPQSPAGPATLRFGLCSSEKVCVASAEQPRKGTNSIHDHTIVSHELGHVLTNHQHRYWGDPQRGSGWCQPGLSNSPLGTSPTSCPAPEMPGTLFHDFADAWVHHFEDTNCVGGWVAKDRGGPDYSKNCQHHDEDNGLPRLAHVDVDRFPEHRRLATSDYANMQIAAAALWEVRSGFWSHLGPFFGPSEYLSGFVRALGTIGWYGPGASEVSSDLHLYRGLLELELNLANEWFQEAPQETRFLLNKILAGFAKAGLFIVPPACIDERVSPSARYCGASRPTFFFFSNSRWGGDAIIDIDDNDPSDDKTINGVVHTERDYLKSSGRPPKFDVWTGPSYVFAKGDKALLQKDALCNKRYLVEVASDEHFSVVLASSGWLEVNRNAWRKPANCHDTWEMSDVQWSHVVMELSLQGKDQLYYRVTTQDENGENERTSLRPANGLWGDVPAPYAIVNGTGSPFADLPPFPVDWPLEQPIRSPIPPLSPR